MAVVRLAGALLRETLPSAAVLPEFQLPPARLTEALPRWVRCPPASRAPRPF